MATAITTPATLADLYREDGKAELIDGRIVRLMPAGDLPVASAEAILFSLHDHELATGDGFPHGDGVGFTVPKLPSGRESFCPDASYCIGKRPKKRMRFVDRAPSFAAEIRSEHDYGKAADARIAAKRADYFQAGTAVVWDVDPLAETVTAYRASDPANPTVFHRGDFAHAEPAVPGWRMKVDKIFDV